MLFNITRFGLTERVGNEFRFRDIQRNSERNNAFYDINVRARKAVVFGKYAGAIFLEVFNLLNTDDLRIVTYDPNPGDSSNAADGESLQFRIDLGHQLVGRSLFALTQLVENLGVLGSVQSAMSPA